MNELIELVNNSLILSSLKTWLMDMSLWNITGLIFILFSIWSISLSVTVDGRESNVPKFMIVILSFSLMFGYPHNLLIASMPFLITLLSLIFYKKPLFMYLNLFMPRGRKLDI